jgi:hypothetical protein
VSQKIKELTSSSDYDFRESACAEDPWRYVFPDWFPYYRTKGAIARHLQPAVLEIGVRFGYSPLAFLNACPNASYLGINVDSNTRGGIKGAIHRARSAASKYHADFLIADSQAMDEFPG